MKMFPVLWVVDFGIVRCCRRRVSIDNFEFNYSESVFGEVPNLGNLLYGFKILE